MERCKFLAIEIFFMHTLVFGFCSAANYSLPRIVGGSPVDIGKIPWQVSLHHNSRYFCGGSIISEWWIATAAHCTVRIKLDDFQVRVGSSRYAEDGYMIDVSRIVHHPNFAERTADYDISLLQLSKALIFTRKIQPIALPNANADIADGTLCATSDWGLTHHPNETREILRKVNVPIVNQELCQELYSKEEVLPSMICAGFVEEGGKDSCQGDSGGPLFNSDSIPQLVGIVSWGYGCALRMKPGVYARVTIARDWIEMVTGI